MTALQLSKCSKLRQATRAEAQAPRPPNPPLGAFGFGCLFFCDRRVQRAGINTGKKEGCLKAQ